MGGWEDTRTEDRSYEDVKMGDCESGNHPALRAPLLVKEGNGRKTNTD